MDEHLLEEIKQLAEESHVDLHKLLGNFYMQKHDIRNSIENFEIYISKSPQDATVLGILGYLYDVLYIETKSNDFIKKAIDYTEKAHSMDAENHQLIINLALMYKDVGLIDKAFEFWTEILKHNPTDENYYDYALLNLKKCNFSEYYKYANHRLNLTIANHSYPKFDKPQWCGEEISDSTLLVHFEQGFGDTIMYSRYLREISKKAKKVIFLVQKELEELFKYNNFGCEICTDISQVGDFDYHIPVMSLMEICKVTPENLLYTDKYLGVDEKTVKLFKEKYFSSDKFKVAIKYCGDVSGPVNRNIPSEKIIESFGTVKNAEIYSFQFEDDYSNSNIINLKDMTNNFYETAAILENMDLVVSTDNVILHLAGALGKKTFGLFNFATESRWFDLTGDDTKWYSSVKPYVANELNGWDEVIQSVVKDIKK